MQISIIGTTDFVKEVKPLEMIISHITNKEEKEAIQKANTGHGAGENQVFVMSMTDVGSQGSGAEGLQYQKSRN